VLEPPNLKLLHKSETAYMKVSSNNKEYVKTKPNKVKRIGFVGQLSQSMTFCKSFWDYAPKNIDIYLYEILADCNLLNPKLKKFNHVVYKGYWFENNKLKRIFYDTFDYKPMAKKINFDNLDILLVTVESIGRFTYGKLFDEITTKTKIILTQPGNYFNIHPKINIQSQLCLPVGWKIKDKSLVNFEGYKIDEYEFIDDLFMYDKRDIKIENTFNKKFTKNIFVHGRLSYVYQIKYLKLIAEILKKDHERKFLFMGIDDKKCLQKIMNFFESNDLKNQVEYLGYYQMNFNEKGKIDHKNWIKTKELLKNSCVFLDPFPKGTGSSRVEAFLSGLPVIDMDIDDVLNMENYNKKDYNISSMIKKNGSAFSYSEYLFLAEKVFIDLNLRQKIISEQFKLAKKFVDEKTVWKRILSFLS